MARIRTIKPEFPQSESMGRVSRESRLCFVLLWTIADDAGRLRGNSRMLASLLYPYDDDAKKLIERWLSELAVEGCILRYTVGGDQYIEIVAWRTHQKIDKPSQSKIPAPPAPSDQFANPREDSGAFAKAREASSGDQGVDQGKDQGGEGSGSDSAEPLRASPPAALIPLVDGSEHPVSMTQVAEWVEAFPAVDVPQQLRQMRQWCIANAANRKTRRGVDKFMVAWLGREQDKARPVAARSGAPPGLSLAGAATAQNAAALEAKLFGEAHAA